MAYLDLAQDNQNRIRAIIAVATLHVLLGYALISGLALTVVKSVTQELKTFNVTEAPAPPVEVPPEPEKAADDTPVVPAKALVKNTNPIVAKAPTMTSPLLQRARWRSGAFYNDSDYPDEALRREQQGSVRISYVIGTDGRVASCTVVGSSGSSALDATTCRIMQKRFRFEPAQDKTGTPIAETRSQTVTWQLGSDQG
ncbi:MAG TPA: energy transducer TonB [Bradyrhizobium sp.]|nr:energy transducer TonB [Allosphingosinicella sp.]HKS20796.1 energy transducer TonB [Bradyrhizobium sp.]